ncbi:MAG: DUF302 domain-containing protein [Actinophytocola sp.]|uniref:DUF302 domain-containing protein n=1 Tax=Actinophytocola sp. TaxID=1872138 RepID=UPI00132B1E0C|nr:DUF302 domain-containing protein [Actinophytocola sp.]
MSYQIEVTGTVPGAVYELHRVVRPEYVGDDIGAGLAELYAEVEAAGLHPAGPPSVTYLDPLVLGHPVNVDLGVPVTPGTGHAKPGTGGRVVGRHSRPVARTVHHGDYTGIAAAYQALEEWIFTHGYRSAGPPTETYLAGPDTVPDAAGYRTAVYVPVVPSIGISVRVADGFAGAVERTRKALREVGFGVLTEIDVRATLREKIGAELEDFLILGACNPQLAKRALDADRQAGLLLPCTVAVRADGDATVVEALDPTILVRATGLPELDPVATEARERLAAALASLRAAG